jgi:hypothetical protein
LSKKKGVPSYRPNFLRRVDGKRHAHFVPPKQLFHDVIQRLEKKGRNMYDILYIAIFIRGMSEAQRKAHYDRLDPDRVLSLEDVKTMFQRRIPMAPTGNYTAHYADGRIPFKPSGKGGKGRFRPSNRKGGKGSGVRGACYQFTKLGKCDRGDSCRYTHDQTTREAAHFVSEREYEEDSSGDHSEDPDWDEEDKAYVAALEQLVVESMDAEDGTDQDEEQPEANYSLAAQRAASKGLRLITHQLGPSAATRCNTCAASEIQRPVQTPATSRQTTSRPPHCQ